MKRLLLVTLSVVTLLATAFVLTPTAHAVDTNVSASDTSTSAIGLIDTSNFKVVDENIVKLHMTKKPAANLFDQQGEVPTTPGYSKIKISGKNWQPTYNSSWGQLSFYVDLGAEYFISDIGYMDTNGISNWTVEAGKPFNWTCAATFTTNMYLQWRNISLNDGKGVTTRYLHFISSNADSGINELALYGYKVSDITVETNVRDIATTPLNLTSGQKIGACAFCDDPLTALDALGNMRDYYNWSWVVAKDGKSFNFNGIVNRDKLYNNLKNMGVTVIPCVQMSAEYFLQDGEKFSNVKNNIPVEEGADTLDPDSYALHSKFMYNLAARYGSNASIDSSTLMTSDKVVGLNTVRAVESWNEQNKDWETKDSYFAPYEYAAMLSADWDGHEGTIENAGVKNADSNMLLSMGGTAGSGSRIIDYLNLMKTWFDFNRKDKEFCADIINVHCYITDEEAPEKSSFRTDIQNLENWIDANVPGRELWLSEFDVKTTDKVISGVDNHDNAAFAKSRADRLLRAYLVAEREGVDISSMFMLRDEWSGVYANSGLTTGKGEWDKKDSWYYISCASSTLENADLIDVYESDSVYVYTYKDRDTSEMIYAVWSPTANDSIVENYQLNISSGNKATMITPTYSVKEGEKEGLAINNSSVTINVTETPVFVKVSGTDVAYDNYPQSLINVQSIRLGSNHGSASTIFYERNTVVNLGAGETMDKDENELSPNFMLYQFYKLFDEQTAETTPANPWVTASAKPTTDWHAQRTAVAKRQSFPYDCIVTFDDYYDLTYIGFYDTYNVGKLEIYNDETDELIYTSNLDSYNFWNLCPITNTGKHVNRIRIVKYSTANLNEMAFYGYKSDSKVGHDVEAVAGDIGTDIVSENPRKTIINIEPWTRTLALGSTTRNFNTVKTSFAKLFDEQDKTPIDTEHTISETIPFSTSFGNVWGMTFPFDCKVSFDKEQTITKVGIQIGWGSDKGKLTLEDTNGNILQEIQLTGKGKWVYIDLDKPITTDELVLVKHNDMTLCEVAFY